jgi:hypothetical protein
MLLKSDLDVQQTGPRCQCVKQKLKLSSYLGVIKFIIVTDMILITVCHATQV